MFLAVSFSSVIFFSLLLLIYLILFFYIRAQRRVGQTSSETSAISSSQHGNVGWHCQHRYSYKLWQIQKNKQKKTTKAISTYK